MFAATSSSCAVISAADLSHILLHIFNTDFGFEAPTGKLRSLCDGWRFEFLLDDIRVTVDWVFYDSVTHT